MSVICRCQRAENAVNEAEKMGLPSRIFFYHLDQIQTMFAMSKPALEKNLFYLGRSIGQPPRDKLRVTNLAPDGDMPEWRVAESHLIIYLKYKGIHFYTRKFR